MAYHCILILVLFGSTALAQEVPPGYIRVALAHHVPPEALYSLSLTESSRKLPHGVRPWPWTINVAGKGYRYETRELAWQALQVFMKHHPLKRIDVGIAQVNLGWNGHHFPSPWQALDPYTNLNAAATILRQCWERQPGSWLIATGCYHHPAGGEPARRYTSMVEQHLAKINHPSLAAPAAFVWTEPES
nr:lytic transglycosylase domain-containing protein [Pantoea cypripedii]